MAARLYTPELANRSLPLVRRIAADVRATALRIQELWLRQRRGPEAAAAEDEYQMLRRRFGQLMEELAELDIELKDPLSGLLDFKARREDGAVVYLCWRLGEESVDHWHTFESGFAGRQPLAEF